MEGRVLCSTYVVSPPYHTVAPACVACCCLSGRLCPEHMRPQAPAYLRIPYTTYPPALACYWVRRPQYVRENIIQGWYRGTEEPTPRFSVHTVHTPQGSVRYFGMYRAPKLTSVRYQIPRTEPGTEPSVHTSAAIPSLSGAIPGT